MITWISLHTRTKIWWNFSLYSKIYNFEWLPFLKIKVRYWSIEKCQTSLHIKSTFPFNVDSQHRWPQWRRPQKLCGWIYVEKPYFTVKRPRNLLSFHKPFGFLLRFSIIEEKSALLQLLWKARFRETQDIINFVWVGKKSPIVPIKPQDVFSPIIGLEGWFPMRYHSSITKSWRCMTRMPGNGLTLTLSTGSTRSESWPSVLM